jgi:hypothetical protein
MITDSNQACITKMSGCGLQEELNAYSIIASHIKSHLLQSETKCNILSLSVVPTHLNLATWQTWHYMLVRCI